MHQLSELALHGLANDMQEKLDYLIIASFFRLPWPVTRSGHTTT
jgi:hypothetical protein